MVGRWKAPRHAGGEGRQWSRLPKWGVRGVGRRCAGHREGAGAPCLPCLQNCCRDCAALRNLHTAGTGKDMAGEEGAGCCWLDTVGETVREGGAGEDGKRGGREGGRDELWG